MNAYISQAPVKLRLSLVAGQFATLRFTQEKGKPVATKETGTLWVRDGRTYSTENRMRGNRSGRPANAKMIKVISVSRHLMEFEEIA